MVTVTPIYDPIIFSPEEFRRLMTECEDLYQAKVRQLDEQLQREADARERAYWGLPEPGPL